MTLRYTLAKASSNYGSSVGLLFETEAYEDVVEALNSDAGRQWFPRPAFIYPTDKGVMVVSRPAPWKYPDWSKKDDYIVVLRENETVVHRPEEHFSRCTQLIRVMGCQHCDHADPGSCLPLGKAPVELYDRNALTKSPFDEDAFRESEPGKIKMGAFEFVSPTLTKTAPFQEHLRIVGEHDFELIKQNHERASDAATKAAMTRKIVKLDCSRCMFGQKNNDGTYRHGCKSSPRYCGGPYASEETQLRQVLEKCNEKVNAYLHESEYTENQFWAVARNAGQEGKLNRCGISLGGWRLDRDALKVFAYRNATNIEEVNLSEYRSYGELRQVFKGLPGTTSRSDIPSGLTKALWFLSLDKSSQRRRSGFGGYSVKHLVERAVTNEGIALRWSSGRYRDYPNNYRSLFSFYCDFYAWPEVTLESAVKPL